MKSVLPLQWVLGYNCEKEVGEDSHIRTVNLLDRNTNSIIMIPIMVYLILLVNYSAISSNLSAEEKAAFVYIQVWGKVRNPGIFVVPPNTNILEAISFAGGPLPSADLNRVKLIRVKGNVKVINISNILKGKVDSLAILFPGDIVIIPQSTTSKLYDILRVMSMIAGSLGALAIAYQTWRK